MPTDAVGPGVGGPAANLFTPRRSRLRAPGKAGGRSAATGFFFGRETVATGQDRPMKRTTKNRPPLVPELARALPEPAPGSGAAPERPAPPAAWEEGPLAAGAAPLEDV